MGENLRNDWTFLPRTHARRMILAKGIAESYVQAGVTMRSATQEELGQFKYYLREAH